MTERDATSASKRSKPGSTASVAKKTPKKAASKSTLASQADRHELYELAVQDPPSEVRFVGQTFKRLRGRPDARAPEVGGFTRNIWGLTLGSPTCNRAPMSASDRPQTFPAARVRGLSLIHI